MPKLLNIIPVDTKIDFMKRRLVALVLSIVLMLASVASLAVQQLNFGIDFAGGILVEARMPSEPDMADMRARLNGLGLGAVSLTHIGENARDVMIRVQQPADTTDEQEGAALKAIQSVLGDSVDYRRVELVGPKVGSELIEAGIWAVSLSILAIVVYIWFRFEWQFAVGAMVALVHDVLVTLGLFSLLRLEFDLTTVAAVLTLAGYSINDTVVVYDRVREKLRKYKKLDLIELLNLSLNKTLSRTILTSFTTLIAVLSLLFLGGDVLRNFSAALAFGIIIGTYSTIYVAVPILAYFDLRREAIAGEEPTEETPNAEARP
ncbi:protein translocase subunit SecF [Roseospira marina]|uniref:Protein-export membrane protein SecF n=1 Tax=Roseospira marina TaxID=140057 RepID=A0A5M6II59_9PROT|nr:protein translocase subunit SecF [Roseospira marina]KAA5607529.1 protein translocase subunit SecF [Roseospira marina]MBB4312286.1 preprotein translocase subunit SecF [Roseospira marina]MBB5085698.1 preprotein translocase subunit SecF [Roseospira marina]